MSIEQIKKKRYLTIMQFTLPSIIAMFLTSLTTLVDGGFIGHCLKDQALSAIQLGLPLLFFNLGIAIMIGVGGVSIVGRLLGKRSYQQANDVYLQTILLTVVTMVISILGLELILPYLAKWITSDIILQNYYQDYYQIMLIAYFINMVFIVLGIFLRAIGKPAIFMMISIIINIINIILDYVFLVKLKYGIQQAASASLISLFIGLILVLIALKKYSFFKYYRFKFSSSLTLKMLTNGSSELINQWAAMITTALFNYVLLNTIGLEAIWAATILGYASYIFNMIAIGTGQGISPLVSFTYGAQENELSKQLIKDGVRLISILGLLISFGFWLFASQFISLFTQDEKLINLVKFGLKIYSCGFIIAGYNIIHSFCFTALGKALPSALISLARGIVILGLLIIILPIYFNWTGIWLIYPLTELLTLGLTFYQIEKYKIS